MTPPLKDIALLLPAFQPKVLRLLERMHARGFDPVVHETYRSAERAIALQKAGKTRNGKDSMHCYRAAVDVISKAHGWESPQFFKALGQEAIALGLTWGGDWDANPKTEQSFDDRPHVQAIPLGKQNAFRLLKTDEERNAFLLRFLARTERMAA
jgi:hypothetical protein